MRILIFHGYLLGGTGSNVYNANLARTLRSLGHEVHLICQERGAADLPWVDAVGDWDEGGLRVRSTAASASRGSVTAYAPDIGGLLPVFVRDRYAGFRVKTFGELTEPELDAYIGRNVDAVRDVAAHARGVDAALANHLVMGPVILARAGLTYALKVHGSDLSYTILPDLERFGPYAAEAALRAAGILVGSTHIAQRLRRAVDLPEVEAKVRLGPPGVDAELFAPLPEGAPARRLRELGARLRAATAEVAGEGSWERDPGEAATAVDWLADADAARVVFVGKLIVSKGVDLLLAAWPLFHARAPGSRLLIAGFGELRPALEELWRSLAAGDRASAEGFARRGRGLEGGADAPLGHLAAFLRDLPAGYATAAREAAGSVAFAGRLEYEEVGALVPAADALVFPSTFPEAFGMVAAEAASAGVLPISAAHSGALEVSAALAAELPEDVAGLVSFPIDDRAVDAIAARLAAWVALDLERRRAARHALHETAVRLWSWAGVARGVIAAAAGELDGLPALGGGPNAAN